MTTHTRIRTLLLDARFRAEDERDDLRVALGILAGEITTNAHQTASESLDYLRSAVARHEADDRTGMARPYRLAYERLANELGEAVEATERKAVA